jgi:poly(A) polymerase
MAASPHVQPISRREDALAIVRRLVDAGHVAYFAGGCVRDALLGLTPKDYDVATSAVPDEVRRLFPRSQGVGQAFGVVLVRVGQSVIEVATFRADGNYTDGRHPDEVHFAGPDEDARRRDFTINGLFFDPLADRVIDLVGGVADLKEGLLRAIGDPQQRFAEDYLRLLRAVRFAARFDLKMDDATAAAIRINADRLPRIAPERIADELRAMFTADRDIRVEAEEWLYFLGLTPVILRHLFEATDVGAREPVELDLRTFQSLRDDIPISFPLALASLSLDALLARRRSVTDVLRAAPTIERALRQTLRLSNEESAALRTILGTADFLTETPPTVAQLKRFLSLPHSAEAFDLLRAIAGIGWHGQHIGPLFERAAAFAPDEIAPPPLVTGDDLTNAGFAPGPKFKAALDAAYDGQLEGRVSTPAEALAVARSILNAL